MSVAALWCPTRVVSGRGVTGSVLADLPPGGRALIVVDPALASRVERCPSERLVLESGATLEAVRRIADRLREQRPSVVVALGGGSVIDSVKVAVAVGAHGLPAFTRHVERGAVLTRRPLRSGTPTVLAVPTTIGTASEVSPVACITTGAGHRLVTGDDLRPHTAVLDSEHLDSLPERLVAEGALEVFLRLAGTAASGTLTARAFSEAVDLGRRILVAGDDALLAGDRTARGRLALLSCESRYSWSAHPGDPFAVRHWYLANELAHAASTGKIAATLTIVPQFWRQLLAGDARLGSAEALERFWRGTFPGNRARADEGLTALADRWRIPRPPAFDAEILQHAVDATVATWTGSRSALAGWDRRLVSSLLGGDPSRRGPGRHRLLDLDAADAASLDPEGEGVNT